MRRLIAILALVTAVRAADGPVPLPGPVVDPEPRYGELPAPGAPPVNAGPAVRGPGEKPPPPGRGPGRGGTALASAGDYYGNALAGLFGGRTYEETPYDQTRPSRPIFSASRRQNKLQFSGFADLSYTLRSINGAAETFNQDQYDKSQSLAQNASLLISGPIWRAANLNVYTQIEQRSFGFNDTRPVWRVFWEDQHNRVTFGDISPTMGDANQFVPFSRRMRGLEARGEFGRLGQYLVFGSQVEGSIRTETFIGDGTPGPYFLTYTPIVDGSAVVVVDGVIQQAGAGDTGDYTLNPSTGELLFNGTRIIPPTSRIEVRYETQGGGGPKDLLIGARLSFTPGRTWHLGVSYLGQLAANDGGIGGPTERRVTDEMTVPTPSAGPFTIRPRPIVVGSETVQVNGILQQRDVDYQIAYETGELQFFQVLPEGTKILVRFSVIEDVDLGAGDRNIYGLDGGVTLGKFGALQFELAHSEGVPSVRANPYSFSGTTGFGSGYGGYGGGFGSDGYSGGFGTGGYSGGFGTGGYSGGFGTGGYSGGFGTGGYSGGFGTGGYSGGFGTGGYSGGSFRGRARGAWNPSRQTSGTQQASGSGGDAYKIAYAGRFGDFALAAEYKSVSDNFSRIDSTGFFQNERGLALTAQYSTGNRFSISHQFNHHSRPLGTTSSSNAGGDQAVTSGGRVSSDLHYTTLSWRVLPETLLTFSRNSQSNSGGGSTNELSREAFGISHRFSGLLQFVGGFDHSHNRTGGLVGNLSQTVSNDSDSTSGRFGLSFNTKEGRFGTRFDYTFSGTKSAVARNRANSMIMSLNYQPFTWGSLQVSHQRTSSRNESLVGRTPRQAGIGAFDDTGTGAIATDPLTGGNVTTSNIQNTNNSDTNISLLLNPLRSLSVTTSYSFGTTDNGRLAGSRNASLQTNLHWQVTDRIGTGIGYNTQWLRYTDSGDRMTTGILNFNFDWRISSRLDLGFDYQSLTTRNTSGSSNDTPGDGADPADTTTGSSSLGLAPKTSFSSWGLDLRWMLPSRGGHSLYLNLGGDNSSGGSFNSFNRFRFETGLDFRLTEFLGARISYNYTDYRNQAQETNNSYSAHLFSAGLGARF